VVLIGLFTAITQIMITLVGSIAVGMLTGVDQIVIVLVMGVTITTLNLSPQSLSLPIM